MEGEQPGFPRGAEPLWRDSGSCTPPEDGTPEEGRHGHTKMDGRARHQQALLRQHQTLNMLTSFPLGPFGRPVGDQAAQEKAGLRQVSSGIQNRIHEDREGSEVGQDDTEGLGHPKGLLLHGNRVSSVHVSLLSLTACEPSWTPSIRSLRAPSSTTPPWRGQPPSTLPVSAGGELPPPSLALSFCSGGSSIVSFPYCGWCPVISIESYGRGLRGDSELAQSEEEGSDENQTTC